MPWGANSARMALPIASSACFVIEYGPNDGPDTTPAIDDDKRRVTELLGQDWAAALDGLPNLPPEQVYEIEAVVVRMHTALEEAKPR